MPVNKSLPEKKGLKKLIQAQVRNELKKPIKTRIPKSYLEAHVPVKELLDFSSFFWLTPQEYRQWSSLQDFSSNH